MEPPRTLIIREEVKELLAQPSFEDRLVGHARRFFSVECEQMGPDGTRRFLRENVARARRHGLAHGPDISSYVDLAFTFGGDFESNYRWAEKILGLADGRASAITMDRLFEAALGELDADTVRRVEDEKQDKKDENEAWDRGKLQRDDLSNSETEPTA